jgi:SAM-dependent methyltransferase
MQTATAASPKLPRTESLQSSWYRYYAGFSEEFATHALRSMDLRKGECVLDPWNGSGTTISSALSLGLKGLGYDLNPVMVVVAKARCLEHSEYLSLRPLASELARRCRRPVDPDPDDPLLTWFCRDSVAVIRAIEGAVQRFFVDQGDYASLKERGVDDLSGLAAFFYVAIFRTIRQILRPFLTSNPTWVKQPKSRRSRLRPADATIREMFQSNLAAMIGPRGQKRELSARGDKTICVASSENLPLEDRSVSCILASPPYCTRIDYAVATSPELAMLGYALDNDFDALRRKLIGTSTVPSETPDTPKGLGETCLAFLDTLSQHSSKASATYYYKNHLQYFRSVAASLAEIYRVLKVGGQCTLVVQDSYYKDIHNDLPAILIEMSDLRGLRLRDRIDFPLGRTLAGVNPGSREYRTSFSAVESVLTFQARAYSRS